MRKPFPRPLWDFLDFRHLGAAEMEGTPQKPKTCRFCRIGSFSGSHFFWSVWICRGLWLLGWPKAQKLSISGRGTHKSPKVVDFVESALFCRSHFQGLFKISWISRIWGQPKCRGDPTKAQNLSILWGTRSFSGSHF